MSKYVPGEWCKADPKVKPVGHFKVKWRDGEMATYLEEGVGPAWGLGEAEWVLVRSEWTVPPVPVPVEEWSHDAGELGVFRMTNLGELLRLKRGSGKGLGMSFDADTSAYLKAALDSHALFVAKSVLPKTVIIDGEEWLVPDPDNAPQGLVEVTYRAGHSLHNDRVVAKRDSRRVHDDADSWRAACTDDAPYDGYRAVRGES